MLIAFSFRHAFLVPLSLCYLFFNVCEECDVHSTSLIAGEEWEACYLYQHPSVVLLHSCFIDNIADPVAISAVVGRAFILALLFFSFPAIVSPPCSNSQSRNFATPRGFGIKRIFAMSISWNISLKFSEGKERQISAIFLGSARTKMATRLPNAKCNQKSKTIMYYGDIWSVFFFCF